MIFDEKNAKKIRLVAFDLDGTLTQHKSPLEETNRKVLEALAENHKLVMVGAGQCVRIFNQMGQFPIDIIGNYGMQFAAYDYEKGTLGEVTNLAVDCDREKTEARVTEIREKCGYTEFTGDNVEFHASGCITLPILGTKAKIEDKLAYDPDRSKRRVNYDYVCSMFPEYTTFVGGSSSFDIVPKPYEKAQALKDYCEKNGYGLDEVAFVGDDYGVGGNDEPVFKSEIGFIRVDDYTTFGEKVACLLNK